MALAVGIVSWSSITSATVSFTTCSMWGRAGTVAAKGTQDSPPAPVSPPQIHYKNTSLAVTYCSTKFILQCWNTYGYFFSTCWSLSKIYSTHFHQLQRAAVLVSCKKQKAIFSFSRENPIFLKKEKKIKIQTSNSLLWRVQGNKHVNTANFWSYVNPTEVETQLHYTNIRFSRM